MERKMKQILFALVLVFSFSWVSASDGKRKEISTVEDVKEMRESQIERLTKRLSQEGLDKQKKNSNRETDSHASVQTLTEPRANRLEKRALES